MKNTENIYKIVGDNVSNTIMTIEENTNLSFCFFTAFITKYRQRAIYGKLSQKIGGIVRDLCGQKGVELHEGHAMPDHIHLLLSVPPKFSVANTAGFIKGKSAIRIHRELLDTKENDCGV